MNLLSTITFAAIELGTLIACAFVLIKGAL